MRLGIGVLVHANDMFPVQLHAELGFDGFHGIRDQALAEPAVLIRPGSQMIR